MRRAARLLAILAVALPGCALLGEEGSGVLTSRRIELGPGVEQVRVGDAFEAMVRIGGGGPSATVTMDDNLLDHLVVEVDGSSLRIEIDGRVRDATLRLEVSVPSLTELEASGASRVEVVGSLTDDVAVEVSGASTATAPSVRVGSLSLDVSGASVFRAAGTADVVTVEVSGASEVDVAGIDASEVVVDASGASEVDVSVMDLLDAVASGASTITYRGDPDRVLVDSSGSSTVERG